MATYDRKFEIVKPDLSALIREALPPSAAGLIDPLGTSPVPLIDGELVQHNTSYQWARGTDAAAPSFFVLDDRGDPGILAARKLTAILGGPSFVCKTLVYDTALTTLYAKVGGGAVNNSLTGSLARWGLVAAGGNWPLGVILKAASSADNRLTVFITGL